jgi:hypothetical protein
VTLAQDGNPSWLGFGVTAFDEPDALGILSYVVFGGQAMPEVLEVRADVDIRDLDQGHVVPNVAPPNWRGIWSQKVTTLTSGRTRSSP